jgi:hypothetical protein
MDNVGLVEAWKKQLREVFVLVSDGKPDDQKKHRAEGFLHALRMAGVIDSKDAERVMEKIHEEVFGETIAARRERKAGLSALKNDDPDAYFDIPTIERR